MANHDCTASGCIGQSLFGINLTCQCCFKPVFLECIQTRNEVAELIQAFGFFDQQHTSSSYQSQQQLTTKIKNCVFASSSVFEFVCVKCKSLGNRFISAIDKQNEQTTKFNEISNVLESTKKQLNDVKNKLKHETENANKLHTKLQQAEIQNQQLHDAMNKLNFDLEQQQIVNRDLESKFNSVNHDQTNGTGTAMDIDHLSSQILTSYNEEIRNSLSTLLESTVARIENSMSTQYNNLIDTLSDNDQLSKRKLPRDTNGLNAAPSSFTLHSHAQFNTPIITQSSNELEPPAEKVNQNHRGASIKCMSLNSKITRRRKKLFNM